MSKYKKPIDLLYEGKICNFCEKEGWSESYSHGRNEHREGFRCKLVVNMVVYFGYADIPCTEQETLYCQLYKIKLGLEDGIHKNSQGVNNG